MPSPFGKLLREVIHLIGVKLPKTGLKSLLSTAHFLRTATEPALFGSITIAPYKQSLENLVDLSKSSPGIASVVKELIYDTRHLSETQHNPTVDRGRNSALQKYNDDLFHLIDFTASMLHDHVNLDRVQEEIDLLSIALRKLPILQSVTVTDGSRQYHDDADAALPGFHMRMLRECGLGDLGAANFKSPPAYTACRSSVMHFAIQHVDRRLERLAYHGSAGMGIFYEPLSTWPHIAPGAPFFSLRALEIHLPQQDVGSHRLTHDTKVFGETLFKFLFKPECNLEELKLSVEVFDFGASLDNIGKFFLMNFPRGILKKLKALELAGGFLSQGIPHDGGSTFQDFLEGLKTTLERLVLRDVALEDLNRQYDSAVLETDDMRDRVSWPRLIDFMHNNLELKTVRLEGKLMSPLHFSWDTTDQDNISLGMPDDIKNNCVCRRIERYILNDPDCTHNPLHHWRYHTTEDDFDHMWLDVPKSAEGDWSWKPLRYELEPYTDIDDYIFHPTECTCTWCLERRMDDMVL